MKLYSCSHTGYSTQLKNVDISKDMSTLELFAYASNEDTKRAAKLRTLNLVNRELIMPSTVQIL